MKKLTICLFIFLLGYTVHAQRFNRFDSDWKVSVGLNAVGDTGSRNPVKDLDQFAFKFPLAVAVEHQWSEQFALEQDITLNGLKEGKIVDGSTVVKKNLTYFSTNTTLKWYFTNYLFDLEELDLFVGGGLGIFNLDKINTSANLSAGAQYWFNEDIGIRLQATAKFATNHKDNEYANNHYQHSLMVMFRL